MQQYLKKNETFIFIWIMDDAEGMNWRNDPPRRAPSMTRLRPSGFASKRRSRLLMRSEMKMTPFRIVCAYAVVTLSWTLFADHLLGALIDDMVTMKAVQKVINILTIILTALLLYALIRRDTIAIRRSEEALRRSEARNQALLNAIPDLMLRIGKDGTFLDFRGAKGSTQTLPTGGFLGKTVHEVMPPDVADQTMGSIERTLQSGIVTIFEYQLPRGDRVDYQEARIVVSWEDEVLAIVRDITERKQAEQERETLITELREALAKVKTLSGLLPICAACKRIRDDNGYWQQIEAYIRDHSQAEFSHAICPECARRLYPDHYKG